MSLVHKLPNLNFEIFFIFSITPPVAHPVHVSYRWIACSTTRAGTLDPLLVARPATRLKSCCCEPHMIEELSLNLKFLGVVITFLVNIHIFFRFFKTFKIVFLSWSMWSTWYFSCVCCTLISWAGWVRLSCIENCTGCVYRRDQVANQTVSQPHVL